MFGEVVARLLWATETIQRFSNHSPHFNFQTNFFFFNIWNHFWVHRGEIDFRFTGSYLQIRRKVERLSHEHNSLWSFISLCRHDLHSSDKWVVIACNISSDHRLFFFPPKSGRVCFLTHFTSLQTVIHVILAHQYDWCVTRTDWSFAGCISSSRVFLSQPETKAELWGNWEPFWQFNVLWHFIVRMNVDSPRKKSLAAPCSALLRS